MNENIEMKPVIDLMGATKKVLTNMAEFFEKARDDAKDRMISPEKFWSYLTKELKTECKIQDDQLLLAGMPTQLVMDTLSLDEAEPVKSQTLTYKNLYLTMKDKSTKKLPIEQVAAKIAPFTKNFKSAMEALVMGDPEAILKVFQHVYGKDVEQWSVPAEESAVHSRFSALAALALSEMYRVGKFNMPSCMFEMKDSKLLVNEAGIKQLVDGFEKADRAWLVSMFPHVVADYLHNIINETKSVLNELPKEVVDKLFVNISPEYLQNLKESELKELAAKFAEATQPKPEEVTKSGGKAKQGTVGKQALPVGPTVKGGIANKKYPSKMAEAVGEAEDEAFVNMNFEGGRVSDHSVVNLKRLGLHVYTDPVLEGSSDIGYIVSKTPVTIGQVMEEIGFMIDELADEEKAEWLETHHLTEL
jgi:hypothetical protein